MAKEVKNGTSRLHVCNGQKLAKILKKKGLNAREFSAELGYHATYLPKVIRTNKIGETAVGLLMSKGIKPTQYDVDMERTVKSKDPVTVADVFNSLPEETKEEVYSEVGKAIEEAETGKDNSINPCKRCALKSKDNGPSDCATCKRCCAERKVVHPVKRISERYPVFEDDKSPAEKAIEEPGVVKIELTLDMVKLKAIVKQAVKEAYEEL